MAFEDYKITSADLNGKGVIGLPDAPQLSAEEMQNKFEETGRSVIIPHFNDLCDYLNANVPDITLPATPVDGDMLVYDSASSAFVFVQKATTLANLKDVDMTGLVNGMYLRYDFPTRSWKPTNSSTSVPALDDINDVSITSAITGQCLVYQNGTWVNDNEKLDDLKNVYIHLPQDGDVLVYDADNDRWVNASGGIGGGHIVVNASGTELTQRPKMQFKGLLKATDNGTDEITEVTDEAEEISFADWDALTEEQREAYSAGKKLDIVDLPDCDGIIEIEMIHLAWTNPSPTSTFASQQIILDTSDCPDYDFVKIRFAQNKNSTASRLTAETEKEKGTLLNYSSATGSGVRAFSRSVSYVDATHLSFSDCTMSTGTTADTTNNDSCIPIEIYIGKYDPTVKATAIATNVSTLASNCMMSDEQTSVEDELATKLLVIKAVESNDPAVMVAWLTAHNADIPVGSSIVDFKYATGVCSKAAVAVGRIRFTSYYSSIDNKSTNTTDGTWSAIS